MNTLIKMQTVLYNICLLIACVMLMLIKVQAQDVSINNPRLMKIAKENSKPGWINFRGEVKLNPITLFEDYRMEFGLSAADEMRLTKSETDETGNTHHRFQQYNNGYKIQGAEYIVHQDASGKVYCANGKMVNGILSANNVILPEQDALSKAMIATGAKGFLWEDANAESRLQARKKNSSATYLPKGELVWSMPGEAEKLDAKGLRLCWKFDINTDSTAISKRMFVDAETGNVIKQLPLQVTCNVTTGSTSYNGTRTIYTTLDGSDYILENDCSGNANIHVYNANTSQTLNFATEFTGYNGTNDWSYRHSQVQTFWGLREAYRYFKIKHSRNGYDGSDADIEGYNNAIFPTAGGALTGNNASWSSGEEVFRFGTGMSNQTYSDDVNTLDIVGHEYTHAVTQYTAGLEYQKESGALNESFSDIFGECVEFNALGSCDFLTGGDIGAFRVMSNPDSLDDPDTYNGDNYQATNNCTPVDSNDNCGVHTNSGLQNFVFYLLSYGDSGINDNGDAYLVNGIGVYSASLIAYKALSFYLTSTSNFTDSRQAWIQSAIDIYGSCSNQVIQAANAWYAVGVGISLPVYNNNICGNYPPGGANYEIHGINSVVGSGTGCANTIIASQYTVTYSGGFQVDLMSGFLAETGSNFIARTFPCAVTNYRPAIGEIGDEEITSEAKLSYGSTKGLISVSPNPFTSQLRINLSLDKSENVTIKLFDMPGKEVREFGSQVMLQEGSNSLEYQTENLSPGVYILKVEINGNTSTQKIIKN